MQSQGGKLSACPTTQYEDEARLGQPFWRPRLNARTAWLTAVFIAVLHAFMAVTAVNTKSPTFDEPQHLTAGYSYWIMHDFRLDPENGNLPAMWASVPLLFDHLNFFPLNDRGWHRAEEGRTAHQFFYEVGNDPEQMMRQARVMMSIFGAALCLLVFRIARHFFGFVGAFVAEIVVAFDPNFLAHSPLVDSDVPAAFFFTATVWTCWCLWQKISPARLTIAALSLSGLFLTKFSAPAVLPILGAMSIVQIFSRNEIMLSLGRFRLLIVNQWKKACALTAISLLLGIILLVTIWASCLFRYSAWTDHELNHEGTVWHWNYLMEGHGLFEASVNFARDHHLLPEQYLYGFAYVRKHEIDRPSFLDNQWSIVGFRLFFLKAFIYKTPLPFLSLLALAICAAIANRRSWNIENVFNPLWGFALLYGAFALVTQLNIGHRHLLPIYPALFIACGAIVPLICNRRSSLLAAAVTICLARQVGESVTTWPNYLAYFNQVAGGPSRGYEHLVDSSLDWGQDLPALKSWLESHKRVVDQKPLYLGYFGTADPRFYQINAQSLSPQDQFARTPVELVGGTYCVSATTLQNVYSLEIGPWCATYERRYRTALAEKQRDERNTAAEAAVVRITNESLPPKNAKEFERLRFGRLCAYLRHQKPVAQVGYSIFVFDLNAEEIAHALYGPPAELLPAVQVNGL